MASKRKPTTATTETTTTATTTPTQEPTAATSRRTRKGIPNRDYAPGDAEPSRCPNCQSTRRTKYFRKNEINHPGVDKDGKAYTVILLRYCKCADCETPRVDRSYENHPAAQV